MADENSQNGHERRLTEKEVAALSPIDFVTLGMFIIGKSQCPQPLHSPNPTKMAETNP